MVDSEWGVGRAYPSSSLRERLVAQIRAVAYDAEELLRATAGSTSDAAAAAVHVPKQHCVPRERMRLRRPIC